MGGWLGLVFGAAVLLRRAHHDGDEHERDGKGAEPDAAAYELEHHDDGGKKSASDHSAQGLLVHFFLLLAAAPSWRMQRKIHLFTRRFAPCIRIYFAGKHTRMQVPFPGSLCSAIVPRCSCTACLTIESPSPVPPEALEWLLSTR